MKTLIIYASKYGCTKDCVNELSKLLTGDVRICMAGEKIHNLSSYDNIIVGGSIYMGKIQKDITKFCKSNKKILMTKKLALFICCYSPLDQLDFINTIYDNDLLNYSKVNLIFGGEMRYDKMNFAYRKLFQSLYKIKDFKKGFVEPQISKDQIIKCAQIINNSNI